MRHLQHNPHDPLQLPSFHGVGSPWHGIFPTGALSRGAKLASAPGGHTAGDGHQPAAVIRDVHRHQVAHRRQARPVPAFYEHYFKRRFRDHLNVVLPPPKKNQALQWQGLTYMAGG
jgi:hypothetical protein